LTDEDKVQINYSLFWILFLDVEIKAMGLLEKLFSEMGQKVSFALILLKFLHKVRFDLTLRYKTKRQQQAENM